MIRASLLAVLLLPFAHPARADVAPSWSRRKVLPTPPCAAQIVPKEKKTTLTFPGGKTIKLDLVDTPSTREIGLMCVTKMPRTYGMMFVFPQDMQLSFWMKNTLVPLDIIWIGADKKITVIHEKLRESAMDTPDEKVVTAGGKGQFVLELASGEASRRKLKAGDLLKFDAAIPDK